MGTYSTTRCSICKTTWSFMEFGTSAPNGPPHVKCNTCGGIIRTRKRWYSKSSKKQKIELLTEILFWDVLAGLLGATIFAMIIFIPQETKSQQESAPMALLFGLILIGYSIVRYFMAIESFKNEKEWIEKYHKNGGYLTQDEFYSIYRH